MQWSITVGRIAGTAIRIHVTFIIFLVWIALADYGTGGAAAAWSSVAFIVLVFACVVAHEFGHILTGRAFGVKTPDVTLLPIGGVANMERIPEKPSEELLIAIAGPMVNVAIAMLLLAINGMTSNQLQTVDLTQATMLERLTIVNVALVVFNLVPAFPMDGGRVLRALLAMWLGFRRATDIAASIGQGFALLFVLAGLFYNPMLIFIGMFIYLAAMSEQQANTFRGFAQGLKVAHGMERTASSLREHASLSEAVDALLAAAQRDFPVVDGDNRPVGLLDRDDLLRSLKEQGPDLLVSAIMRPPPLTRENISLEDAVTEMNRERSKSRIVVDAGGCFIGMLTFDNVAEMMMIHDARPDWHFSRMGRGQK